MELLALFEESVVLSETFKCQLVRNLNVLGVGDVALLEVTDLNWVGCAKQADLAVIWHHLENLLNDFLELSRNETINFIKDANFALVEFSFSSLCQIKDSSWSCDHHVDSLAHTDDILIDTSTTCGDHALHALMLSELLDDKRCLHSKLSDRDKNQSLDLVQSGIDLIDQGDAVSCGFTSTVLGLSDDVFIIHDLGNGLLLDR